MILKQTQSYHKAKNPLAIVTVCNDMYNTLYQSLKIINQIFWKKIN